jgi:hypothetical protein
MLRSVIISVGSTLLLATAIVIATSHSHAVQQPIDREELVVLGPFPVGDLYSKLEQMDFMEKQNKLDKKEIVKALNNCKFYVIDWKRRQKGGWTYSEASEKKRPKILLEGRLSFSFTGKSGDSLYLHLEGIRFVGVDTENESRSCPLGLTFGWTCFPQEGSPSYSGGFNCQTTDRFQWDVSGKTSWRAMKKD